VEKYYFLKVKYPTPNRERRDMHLGNCASKCNLRGCIYHAREHPLNILMTLADGWRQCQQVKG